MENTYYQKYLKYKNKYLDLKNSIEGGKNLTKCLPNDDGKSCEYKSMFSSKKKEGLCLEQKCIPENKYNKSPIVIERLQQDKYISEIKTDVVNALSRDLDRFMLIKQKDWYSMIINSYGEEKGPKGTYDIDTEYQLYNSNSEILGDDGNFIRNNEQGYPMIFKGPPSQILAKSAPNTNRRLKPNYGLEFLSVKDIVKEQVDKYPREDIFRDDIETIISNIRDNVIREAIKTHQNNVLSSLEDFFKETLPRIPEEKKEIVTNHIKSWIVATYYKMHEDVKKRDDVFTFGNIIQYYTPN